MQPVMQTPVAHAIQHLAPRMGVLHGMEVALEFEGGATEMKRKQILGICDVSCFPRFGVKGLNVIQWLTGIKIEIPQQPNSWHLQQPATMVMRLGGSEFLIEDQPGGEICKMLIAAGQPDIHGVYRVQRYDTALTLSGSAVLEMLSELCTLDLRDKAMGINGLVMTQMAGISVTLLRHHLNGEPVYRLWCDGTYGPYIWETLSEIAQEFGGGAIGLSCHFKEML